MSPELATNGGRGLFGRGGPGKPTPRARGFAYRISPSDSVPPESEGTPRPRGGAIGPRPYDDLASRGTPAFVKRYGSSLSIAGRRAPENASIVARRPSCKHAERSDASPTKPASARISTPGSAADCMFERQSSIFDCSVADGNDFLGPPGGDVARRSSIFIGLFRNRFSQALSVRWGAFERSQRVHCVYRTYKRDRVMEVWRECGACCCLQTLADILAMLGLHDRRILEMLLEQLHRGIQIGPAILRSMATRTLSHIYRSF